MEVEMRTRLVHLALWICAPLSAQSFVTHDIAPLHVPAAVRPSVEKWNKALAASDWREMKRLGDPWLRIPFDGGEDGGKDWDFFLGFTHYAEYLLSKSGSPEAMKHILRAYELVPEQGEICYQAGRSLLYADRSAEAVKPLRDAVRIYPFPDARVDLAVALNGSGAPAEALDMLETLDDEFPNLRRIQYERANALVALKRPQEAEPILRELIRRDPKDVGALNELAYACSELGRPEEALQLLKKSAELRPKDPFPWVEMVDAYLRMGQITNAKQAREGAKLRGISADLLTALDRAIHAAQAAGRKS